MKTMNSSHTSGCPDTEALAEFAANPDPTLFPGMAVHIRECACCRAAARQHRLIARAMEAACEPPEGLADRIRASVYKDAQVRSRRFRGLWFGAAAAAVLALSLHAVFANWNAGAITTVPDASVAMNETSAEMLAGAGVAEEAPAPVSAPVRNAFCKAEPLPGPMPEPGAGQPKSPDDGQKVQPAPRLVTNNLEFARPVAAQLTPEFGFGDESALLSVRHRVASNVAHIWKTSSPFSLQAAAARHQCRVLSVNDSHTGYDIYTLQGNDAAIQALVDDLYSNNWVLYSADYPQPGQQPSTVFTDATVRYEMKVIR